MFVLFLFREVAEWLMQTFPETRSIRDNVSHTITATHSYHERKQGVLQWQTSNCVRYCMARLPFVSGWHLVLIIKVKLFENQGWEFSHSLICSFRSNQMSNCERFAQIAQDKGATVSESLRSLRGNERL